ncbi:hypothetical protein TRIUR3_23900 [Triticum urartu]|uniref:Uncharacterized protein n=1 Tax=Triticum urartu TaxID=4572 RepID=M7Z885_TRIUA|nr:hypothetical protein TRIUR3_23900 [Triticum urartu]
MESEEISTNMVVEKEITILIDEDETAEEKFEGEFELKKMDTMMHRFPAGLGLVSISYQCIVPRVVAIGPYHHGKEHLKKMEEVKKAAASYFCPRWDLEPAKAYKEVLSVVEEVRGRYIADEIMEYSRGARLQQPTIPDDAHFAAMMFRDACFLLLYMEAVYSRSFGKEEDEEINASLRRYLFSNRDSIDNDIMLLENQLPWRVVQVLMDVGSEKNRKELFKVVGKFIAGMGNTFKICESLLPETYVWDDKNNPPPHLLALLRRHKTEPGGTVVMVDGNNPPPHLLALLRRPVGTVFIVDGNNPPPDLLALLRRHKTEPGGIVVWVDSIPALLRIQQVESGGNFVFVDATNPPPLLQTKTESDTQQAGNPQSSEKYKREEHVGRCLPLCLPRLPCQEENPMVTSVSAMSPMELEEIGIKLTDNQTAAFSDMDLVKGRLLSELSLAPLSLSDTRASCLVNMAAFEVCTASRYGDCPKNTAVCSSLALLAMFMARKEGVHKLRSKGLLHGPHSDKEMLTFFKSVVMHLPDSGSRFAYIMKEINEYKLKRYIRIILYKWFYNNYVTIIKGLSFLGTLIGLYSAIHSLSQDQKN